MKSVNPSRAITLSFIAMVAVGTLLLMLPIARTGAPTWPEYVHVPQAGPALPGGAPFSVALFTAVSASCVTGLVVVDTGSYWSHFGQLIILLLIQVGGIGTMTVAAYIAVTLRRRLNLRRRIQVSEAVSSTSQANLGEILGRVMRIAVLIQLVGALLLSLRFYFKYGYRPLKALWHGFFHASSAFNNAGFALYYDSLVRFNTDPCIILVVGLCIILGGLGFPVFVELLREMSWKKNFGLRIGVRFVRNIRPGMRFSLPKLVKTGRLISWQRSSQKFSMNVKLVLYATLGLILVGWFFIALLEWNNPKTLGHMTIGAKLLNAFFSSVSPRTAGFNSVDIGSMHSSTWFGTDFLMIIGGGPASTAGGLKVTTIMVIIAVTWAQIHGYEQVHFVGYRLSPLVQGQVITLLGLSLTLVVSATMAMMMMTPYNLDRCLFEVISAFGTVGLTTGITPTLPIDVQLPLTVLMIIGRLGPVTLASSLALRTKPTYYSLPESRPAIG